MAKRDSPPGGVREGGIARSVHALIGALVATPWRRRSQKRERDNHHAFSTLSYIISFTPLCPIPLPPQHQQNSHHTFSLSQVFPFSTPSLCSCSLLQAHSLWIRLLPINGVSLHNNSERSRTTSPLPHEFLLLDMLRRWVHFLPSILLWFLIERTWIWRIK